MILFPNAKINLGLNIVRRRPDGYHDIETVMVPTGWCDVLEIVPAASGEPTALTCSGRPVDCPPERNLVMKAFRAVQAVCPDMPQARIFLRKIVPDGAGLGGGSADAAFTITGLNTLFGLGLTPEAMAAVAATVGADCPFFIYNRPMLCTGTGTTMRPVDLEHGTMHVAIAKPSAASVSTARAYAGVHPHKAEPSVAEAVAAPVGSWQQLLHNDFEATVEAEVPAIGVLKRHMEACGAVYSAMSGSGSAVFGLFESANLAEKAISELADCDCYAGPVAL